ncbi:MAG: N-acetylmuramoyl-L-alanine amidase [Bacteroidaceae bacterium]|nr:N-acetylmuramoyl-L-alanine amidase [Bacteroidaceae bacterium]
MIRRYIATFLLLFVCLLAMPYTLVIDAGHGGKDPGAMANGAKEKSINLAVALAFGKLVEQNCKDVKVVYTRKTDTFVELNERANIANRNKADLFISIHTNATAAKVGPRGTETYTLGMHRAADNLAVAKRENSVITLENDYEEKYEGFDPNSSESYIIFELMQDKNMESSVKLASLVQKQFRTTAGRVDKGVHQAGFLVLRATSMPSVLIELGYINNASEATYLTSTAGVNALAKSIYNAFVAYKKK